MKATELALGILRGEKQRYITVKQVSLLASLCRQEEGKQYRGFQTPDYTISRYTGTSDGWELFRMPNGAGILKLISHSAVVEVACRREHERAKEEIASRVNAEFERCLHAGIDPMKDPACQATLAEYRALCGQ